MTVFLEVCMTIYLIVVGYVILRLFDEIEHGNLGKVLKVMTTVYTIALTICWIAVAMML